MAELYGRQTGYCKGKGGSMHIADFAIGMLGANGIVAGGIAIVTGAGLAAQNGKEGRRRGRVFRGRRIERGALPRVPQYRGDLEVADALMSARTTCMPRIPRARRDACPERRGGARRRLRHPRGRRRRQRHLRGPSGGQCRGGAGAFGGRPDPHRVQDLTAGAATPSAGGRPIPATRRRSRRGSDGTRSRSSNGGCGDQGELDDAGLRGIEGDIMGALEAAVAFAEASPFPTPSRQPTTSLRRDAK